MRYLAAICSVVSMWGCAEETTLRPGSVVLVTIDTLRADRLGVYGGDADTPHLDALSHAGARFTSAMAQSPLTLPSHSSILTGTYPTYHGVRDNGRYRLDDEMETLAEMMQASGYATAAFVGGFPVDSRFGLRQGFDVYDDDFPRTAAKLSLAERRAEDVIASATSWLRARAGTPYFLWVHLFDPHAPYAPPEPFESSYEGEVSYVDAALGDLFSAVSDDTLVVVTADHGEGLGEHGERTHSLFVYDSTMRIPLIIKGPGVTAATVIDDQVRSIDLVPTVLELSGSRDSCASCQGSSLVPLLTGGSLPELPSYGETYFPRLNLGWSELKSLRTTEYKLIDAPVPELYDLASDPGETVNVAARNPQKLDELSRQLARIEESTRGVDAADTGAAVDPDTVSMLRSLGYVSAARPPQPVAAGALPDPKSRLHVWEAIRSGMDDLAMGRWTNATTAFEEVLEEEPELLLARSHVAAAYFETRRYEDAAAQCAEILEREPSDPEAMLLLGKSALRLGDLSKASEILTRAAELDPESPEPWVELSQLRLSQNRRAEANTAFEKARAVDAGAYSVLVLEGKFAMLNEDAATAESLFRSALDQNPIEEEARVQLGNVLLAQRRLDEAEALFAQGIRLRPQTASFHLGLGHSRALAQRLDVAIPELEKALALDPRSPMVLNSLAFAYLESGNPQRGAELLRRSLELEPRQPQISGILDQLAAR